MTLRKPCARRPSAALIVSFIAFVVSFGGAGYAAPQLPANSVGTGQLRDNSVSYKKIQPEAVGRVRANLNQRQARVNGMCRPQSAVATIQADGKPVCRSTLPPTV